MARLKRLIWRLTPGGARWIVIPKAPVARRLGLDLKWEAMQAQALQTDLGDSKVASLTEEQLATRFVIRKEWRADYPRVEPEE